jgi:hypothetical protein
MPLTGAILGRALPARTRMLSWRSSPSSVGAACASRHTSDRTIMRRFNARYSACERICRDFDGRTFGLWWQCRPWTWPTVQPVPVRVFHLEALRPGPPSDRRRFSPRSCALRPARIGRLPRHAPGGSHAAPGISGGQAELSAPVPPSPKRTVRSPLTAVRPWLWPAADGRVLRLSR